MTALELVRANLRRNRLRTGLTGAAVALAITLVCFLLSMPAGLEAILDRATSDVRISVVHRAGLVYALPQAFARRIRALPGVADAMSVVWFGGSVEKDGRITFPSFAVEAEHVAGTYPDYGISEEVLRDFERHRDGALVGRATLARYGWRPGDRITLSSGLWNLALEVRIVGEIPREGDPVVWIHREYLARALEAAGRGGLGIAGMIWVRVEDGAQVGAVMDAIDELTRRTDSPTTQQTERSFFGSFLGSLRGLLSVILAVAGLVTLCIVFIAGNTAALGIRERAAEIAVLKALGFRARLLFALLLAETVALCGVAGAAGAGLAMALSALLRHTAGWVPALGPLGGFRVGPALALEGWCLAAAVGLAAGVLPSWGAAKRPVAEALRETF